MSRRGKLAVRAAFGGSYQTIVFPGDGKQLITRLTARKHTIVPHNRASEGTKEESS